MKGRSAAAAAWGGLVARHRWAFVGAWLVLFAVAAVLAAGTPRLLSPSGFETDTEASRTSDQLRQQFPERRGPVLLVVFQSPAPAGDPAYRVQMAAWRSRGYPWPRV